MTTKREARAFGPRLFQPSFSDYPCAVFLLLLLPLGALAQDSLRILSPNGKLQFRFSLLPGGIPSYDITENGRAVVLPSRLGLTDNTNLPSGRSWDQNLQIIRTARHEVSTAWKPVWGERSEIPDRYRELTVTLRHADRDRGTFQVIARAYDEGVAFRYFFPEEGRTQILDLGAELTEFRMPEGTEGYWTERAQTSYRKRPLEKLGTGRGNAADPPAAGQPLGLHRPGRANQLSPRTPENRRKKRLTITAIRRSNRDLSLGPCPGG